MQAAVALTGIETTRADDRAGVALPRLHRREHLLPGIAAVAAPPLYDTLVAHILDETS